MNAAASSLAISLELGFVAKGSTCENLGAPPPSFDCRIIFSFSDLVDDDDDDAGDDFENMKELSLASAACPGEGVLYEVLVPEPINIYQKGKEGEDGLFFILFGLFVWFYLLFICLFVS